MNTTFDKSRDLIKESTSFKKTDIQRSISLIEQAIQICPEFILEDKFKLSGYNHLAGNIEKAYNILFDLLNEMKLSSTYTIYNMYKMQVYEKICTLCFKDKKFLDYIFYYSLQRYNTNLAIYTQGRRADYERGKENFDLFGASYSTKINSCFKKLNKESNTKIFSDKFAEFFIFHKQDLLFILEKSHLALWTKDYDITKMESVGERAERILKSDNGFINIATKYTDEYFIDYYYQTLRPLID